MHYNHKDKGSIVQKTKRNKRDMVLDKDHCYTYIVIVGMGSFLFNYYSGTSFLLQ